MINLATATASWPVGRLRKASRCRAPAPSSNPWAPATGVFPPRLLCTCLCPAPGASLLLTWVFTSYGPQSNDSLMQGFAEANNPQDVYIETDMLRWVTATHDWMR
ncbi:hypothetical protein Vretimale_18442 [Volvox reticuliferus]|nr:hypothetical protein Vretimale_18442 [Volvox reticuliferus]